MSHLRIRLLFAATAVATLSAPALAQGESAARCQGIADAAARLACYDAVFPPKPASASTQAIAPQPTPKPAAPSAADEAVAQFGLVQKPKDESIESSVGADFYGWGPNDRIRLANGQVWEVVDSSSGTITPEMRKVKVRRGLFGSYFLDFEGLGKSPKVRRIQ